MNVVKISTLVLLCFFVFSSATNVEEQVTINAEFAGCPDRLNLYQSKCVLCMKQHSICEFSFVSVLNDYKSTFMTYQQRAISCG